MLKLVGPICQTLSAKVLPLLPLAGHAFEHVAVHAALVPMPTTQTQVRAPRKQQRTEHDLLPV